jgi:hypothetical protein
MKMFTYEKRSAICGLRKKKFSEFKYLVICGTESDYDARVLHHGILSKTK